MITSAGPVLNLRPGMTGREGGPDADGNPDEKPVLCGAQANSYETQHPLSSPLHGTWYHPGLPKTRSSFDSTRR